MCTEKSEHEKMIESTLISKSNEIHSFIHSFTLLFINLICGHFPKSL